MEYFSLQNPLFIYTSTDYMLTEKKIPYAWHESIELNKEYKYFERIR